MPWKNGDPPLYTVWRDMLGRCYRQNSKQYNDYGGRGITVCTEWKTDFKQFFADMYPTYQRGLTLDRIDNDGNYCKDNCKWSTRKEQQRNQRVTRRVIVEGIEYIAADLADINGLKTDTIVERAALGLSYVEVISPTKRTNLSGFTLGAAISAAKRNARTHCSHGHEYTPENTSYTTSGKYTWRSCRRCHSDRENERRRIKKAAQCS